MLTVASHHGPAERAVHLFQTLHYGLTTAIPRIVASDATTLVRIEKINGSAVVHVNDILPPPLAHALSSWVSEMLTEDTCGALTCHPPGSKLLYFRELVMAVEKRVRNCWAEADRLHEAFAQSITQILTYKGLRTQPIAPTALLKEQLGQPTDTTACTEMQEFPHIDIRVTKGILMGWLTLTHNHNNLQGQPLEDVWNGNNKCLDGLGKRVQTYHEVHPASVSMHRGTVLKQEDDSKCFRAGITTQNEVLDEHTLHGNNVSERGEANGSKTMFSLSSVNLFRMIGVDSCIFLIFTTRIDPNKRNKHRIRSMDLLNQKLKILNPKPRRYIRSPPA